MLRANEEGEGGMLWLLGVLIKRTKRERKIGKTKKHTWRMCQPLSFFSFWL
jgi:hypothetical protein